MNRRSAIALLSSSLALTGCWGGNNWHQKLKVTVQTPQGEVSGSSVTEVSFTFPSWGGVLYRGKQRGEAVVVDLGDGKYLFALLEERQQRLAFEAFYPPENMPKGYNFPKSSAFRQPIYYAYGQPNPTHADEIEASRKTVVLPSKLYPPLVTFGNLNEPNTVREVKPGNLAEQFGSGYALKSITLEITDSSITDNRIEAVLNWISNYHNRHLDGNDIESIDAVNRLANSLAAGNFKVWRY